MGKTVVLSGGGARERRQARGGQPLPRGTKRDCVNLFRSLAASPLEGIN